MKAAQQIVHIITDLNPGGAETMLARLLALLKRGNIRFHVISLTGDGKIGELLRAEGIPVSVLGFDPQSPNPLLFFKLVKLLLQLKPDGVHTWLYHADLLGGLAARLAGNIPVIWALHNSTLDSTSSKRRTLRVVRLCAWLSHFVPQKITCCSTVSRDLHIQLGYKAEKMVFIPNGFDLEVFQPNADARLSVRAELGLFPETPLVGFMARFDPQKDLNNFIQAASLLHQRLPEVRFLLAGTGIQYENTLLVKWINQAQMNGKIFLLGRRDDTPRLTAALDLATVSSAYGEAFPLVIGEAMSCEVPCVATDVGDSKMIIGATGRVVPPRDPQALADAWYAMLSLPASERRALGRKARQIIADHYSISVSAERHQNLYRDAFNLAD